MSDVIIVLCDLMIKIDDAIKKNVNITLHPTNKTAINLYVFGLMHKSQRWD